jgi:hypothetical protein
MTTSSLRRHASFSIPSEARPSVSALSSIYAGVLVNRDHFPAAARARFNSLTRGAATATQCAIPRLTGVRCARAAPGRSFNA